MFNLAQNFSMATKTSRPHARRYCFTLNNYTRDEEEAIKQINCEWLVFGHEHSSGQGTPHLQGAITFNKRTYLATLKKLIPRAHFEIMQGNPQQSKDYCTKEDTSSYFEKGIMPKPQHQAGNEANEAKWESAYQAAKEGRFDDIPRSLWIKHMRSFKQIFEDAKQDTDMTEYTDQDLKHHFLWIWGPTGTGKSHTAHRIAKELSPDEPPYIKDLNKWWNGFTKQRVVIIEEADPKRCEHLASYFKKWADKWAFTAEAKGTVFPSCRPEYIIVTSNYSIAECFPEDADRLPLERRFTEQYLPDRKLHIYWPQTQPQQTNTGEPNVGPSDPNEL
ncbi:Rep [Pelorivirus melia]|uniref:ATP-dependent helicase Rep n=1 Tax=Circular ssDNA virus sp. TaxID=2805939 RepID=A0A1W5PVT7_9VIRU|nr:Rep [Circular ssDNA virus sp.]